MVSSNGYFDWMDDHPSNESSQDCVAPSHSTLWISDQDQCVDSLLNRAASQFGDPVARFPADSFGSSQNMVLEIRASVKECHQLDIIVVGHSCFLPLGELMRVRHEFSQHESLSSDSLIMRVARKQRLTELAKQRLLAVSAELAHAFSNLDHSASQKVLVTPLFFRPESGAICFYNEHISDFQAIGNELISER
ncbi:MULTISPECIES: hypothetical protein [Pirellulaceae]|uniref:hypothetical protein n=1 Tax=Pirellulaceae TaxID=2691357 RepID=UPI0011B0A95B|nr:MULTISPECIES: hypothetical protein [Pirellulaceae]